MAYNYVVTVRLIAVENPRHPRASPRARGSPRTRARANKSSTPMNPTAAVPTSRSDHPRIPARPSQAQKPTSVTHSLVGNFTHDNELNLIVA